MRQERNVQATIFKVFAQREIWRRVGSNFRNLAFLDGHYLSCAQGYSGSDIAVRRQPNGIPC
jgi:prepilin-type processing-associated H-X9-DG protein